MKQLTDDQIEMIADLFAKAELPFMPTDTNEQTEWILCHAFIKGMKFYREFTEDQ